MVSKIAIVILILLIFYLYKEEIRVFVQPIRKRFPNHQLIRYKTEKSETVCNDSDNKNLNYGKYISKRSVKSPDEVIRNPNVEFTLDYGPSSKYKVDTNSDKSAGLPVYNTNNTLELNTPEVPLQYLRTMNTKYDSETYNAEIKEKIKNKNSNLGGGVNDFNNVSSTEGIELSVEDKLNLSEVKPVGYEMSDNGYFGGARLLKGEYGNVPVYMYDDYDNARTTQWRVPSYGLYMPNTKAYWKAKNLPEEANKWASVKNTIYNYPYYPH
jgi:hypothetical protein